MCFRSLARAARHCSGVIGGGSGALQQSSTLVVSRRSTGGGGAAAILMAAESKCSHTAVFESATSCKLRTTSADGWFDVPKQSSELGLSQFRLTSVPGTAELVSYRTLAPLLCQAPNRANLGRTDVVKRFRGCFASVRQLSWGDLGITRVTRGWNLKSKTPTRQTRRIWLRTGASGATARTAPSTTN